MVFAVRYWLKYQERLPNKSGGNTTSNFQKERIPWDSCLFGDRGVRQGLGPIKRSSLTVAENSILPFYHFKLDVA